MRLSVIEDVVSLRPGKGLVRHAASEVEWGYRVTSPPTEIVLRQLPRLQPGDYDAIARDVGGAAAPSQPVPAHGRGSHRLGLRNAGQLCG